MTNFCSFKQVIIGTNGGQCCPDVIVLEDKYIKKRLPGKEKTIFFQIIFFFK